MYGYSGCCRRVSAREFQCEPSMGLCDQYFGLRGSSLVLCRITERDRDFFGTSISDFEKLCTAPLSPVMHASEKLLACLMIRRSV